MYTRCPECQTAFRITVAQLKARDGLVRCGRCDSIFRADLRLFAPSSVPAEDTSETEMFIDLSAEESIDRDRAHAPHEIPIITDFSVPPSRERRTMLWFFASLTLALLWLGQFVYFYRDELAQVGDLQPALVKFCEILRCKLANASDTSVPELVQTSIAPHPRYANALRIRAAFVNRAEQPLELPLMQISVTDIGGQLLARRVFAPREYLVAGAPATVAPPNVVVQALLDVTNPENKASSYEVQLFRQLPARQN
jgi:predicted Zn finger-like uncharacterized protein